MHQDEPRMLGVCLVARPNKTYSPIVKQTAGRNNTPDFCWVFLSGMSLKLSLECRWSLNFGIFEPRIVLMCLKNSGKMKFLRFFSGFSSEGLESLHLKAVFTCFFFWVCVVHDQLMNVFLSLYIKYKWIQLGFFWLKHAWLSFKICYLGGFRH